MPIESDGSRISDGICIFNVLFLGNSAGFPCGDGSSVHAANAALLDWQPDGGIDISDGIALLQHLFTGGPPHTGGALCVPIAACPEACKPGE